MKQFVVLCMAIGSMVFASHGQLVGVISEEVIESGGIGSIPVGFTTYRIYALLQDPTDRVQSVFGTTPPLPQHHLSLGTSSNQIWNSGFAGATGSDNNCEFWSFFPEAQWDSYATIGLTSSGMDDCLDCAGTMSTIFQITNPAGVIPSTFAVSPFGPNLSIIDGGWYIPNDGSCNGFGQGPDNRVLLAQMTVPTGTLEYCLNITVLDEAISENLLIYVHGEQDPPGFQGDIPEIDGSALGLCGGSGWGDCTDPLACNYNPAAEIDDGSCLYGTDCNGCTDYAADNYTPGATVDDGSCLYTITGHVFRDTNQDGVFNGMDYDAENVPVIIMPENITMNTDALGLYEISGVGPGAHTVSVDISTTVYTGNSTPASIDFEPSLLALVFNFGVTNDEPFYDTGLSLYYPWSYYLNNCNFALPRYFSVSNDGNTTVDPVVTINYDTDLELVYSEPAFSSSVPGEVQFALDPLIPGSTDYISLVFAPPGEELAGELLTFDADLEVYDGGVLQQSANESSWMYVLCSYDPNAKYAYPAGFTDSHFITGDGPLDYTIVFQNTGSSVAQNVTLQDTLDTDLDFATLEILGASHDMNHVLDESTGELFFVFQNINLPDSTSNEPASHGYVHYRIWPDAGLAAGTQLNNTAWIYFDGNEPVITNTTWHEIFDCNGLANITGETEYCLGENLALSASQQWVESFGWTVNGALSDTDAILDVLTTQSGMLSIGLTSENEICSETDEVEVQVYEWQLSDFTVAFDGTTWTFTGNDGEAWQWYYNGEEIDGAVEQTYESTEEGWYSLFTTTTTGCDIISEPMLVLSTDDITGDAVTFFPNPTDDIITFSRPVDHVALYDLSGQAVLETSRTTMLDLSLLAPGYYLLELEGSVMPVLLK